MDDQRLRPTLNDLAEAAFVSRATASVAFTGRGRISAKTREHVLDVARQLGYRPNMPARYFRQLTRTPLVAIAFSDMPDGSGARTPRVSWLRVITAFITELSQAGISTVVIPKVDEAQIDLLPVEAVVAIAIDRDQFAAFHSIVNVVPIIAAGTTAIEPGVVAAFEVDYCGGVWAALDHLVQQGSERPALMLTEQPLSPVTVFEDCYDAWCADHRVAPRRVRSTEVRDSIERLLLSGADSVVVGVDDRLPELDTLLAAIADRGLRIPHDFKIVLIADEARGESATPTLTTLNWSGDQAGVVAGKAVLAGLETGSYESASFPFELTVRESTQR